ncbi:MAG TPA: heavy metal translocating P-type ATPase [Caulobacteraceae bacterium]|nr:heavy metal translocating P-type ATPase [Caulobacteraceae bacterium]
MTVIDTDLSAFVAAAPEGRGRVELLVRGARCAACLSKIEHAAAQAPGVEAARLNLTTGKLTVILRTARGGNPGPVIAAVEAAGYPCSPFDPGAALAAQDAEGRRLTMALAVAAFGAGNVMMFSVPVWAGVFGQELTPVTRMLMYWFSALVATPCALYAGMPFFQSAWRSLRRGKANMDVPITIAVLLTLIVSFSETIQGGPHAYFDAAVTLLFLLLIGRWLDHQLRIRAQGAARDLIALQAPIARRISPDGLEHGVPTGEIAVGDRIAVLPGDRAPIDGVVESGASQIDNALITGETTPVLIGSGATIYAGALNLSGRLVVRATARSEDSTLANIARLVEAGAQSKSRYVRLADRAASLYVPVVHSLALGAFLFGWALGLGPREALLRAAAVLIVTCPCALGLAVPAVQVAACGRLFRRRVLVKSGAALERLAEADVVVLDKTGVLTEGRPRLLPAMPADIAAAAPLARASRHPLAQALARAAGPGPVAEEVREVAGQGVEGRLGGRGARLGRAGFATGGEPTGAETELWFAREGDAPIRFAFADRLRPDAVRTVSALKARGLAVLVLSGDAEGPVARAVEASGVAEWRAGLTPIDKVAEVERLARAGHKVAMVGDGLNDAAALAKAHVSIAPGTAVEASQSAADLVFENDRLMSIVEAIDVARAARGRALENFGFSALYNIIAAPVAILGLVNPFLAAIAMSASSIVVTLNALRMNWAGGRA